MADPAFTFGTTPFYFLRHGETDESRAGILQGQNETELNAVGRQMAEAAAEVLVNVPLRSIYASPLKRTWKTAAVVSVLTGVPVYPLPELMERHWGKYQGLPKAERPSHPNPETAESLEDFTDRVAKAMESIPGPSPVLIVAHSGVFRALCDRIGIATKSQISVTSGEVLMVEPPAASGERWRISAVSGGEKVCH